MASSASAPAPAPAAAPQPERVAVPRGQLSRLLYANPVCILTSCDPRAAKRNAMVISWLTPINNHGLFVASMNAGRFSAQLVRATRQFVLSVPIVGHEELLCRIGGCSGASWEQRDAPAAGEEAAPQGPRGPRGGRVRDAEPLGGRDKIEHLRLPVCAPGWGEARPGDAWIAIEFCVAHACCSVQTISEVEGHLLMTCRLEAGWARPGYWDGKVFAPRSPASPPFLSFLGSQRFAATLPLEHFAAGARGRDEAEAAGGGGGDGGEAAVAAAAAARD